MKRIFLIISLLNFYITMTPVMAQIGEPYIHDPSTPAECDGKYYTFGTGGGGWSAGCLRLSKYEPSG